MARLGDEWLNALRRSDEEVKTLQVQRIEKNIIFKRCITGGEGSC